jgi:hypothetical protein
MLLNQIGVELNMTSRRVTPLLLAASIFLTGATGAFIGSTTSAHAITSVDELTDVNHSHWAYDALRDLVEKYDVIEGYPDHTFRGERNATRWELAAALNALIKSVGRDLARLGAEKADKTDLETLAKLQDEFKNELAALQARTDALESRASAIEAKNTEQDTRLTLLERTQLHGDASIGGFADMNTQGTRAPGAGDGRDGIADAISAVGRVRLTMDIPVKEDKEDSKIGAGDVHTRMIAAFGRISPNGANGNNFGGFGSYNSVSRIASDASANNEGSAGGTANLRTSLYIENLHYHQHFKAGIPLLTDWMMGAGSKDKAWATTGDMYVGQIPWRYLYDKSPYRGNEQNQFQNSAFVNTPGIALNQSMPMIAYQWHQKLGSDSLSADLTSGLGTATTANALNGLNVTYEGRLNYSLLAHAGNLYGGGYHVWNDGNGNFNSGTVASVNRAGTAGASQMSSTNAFYAGWNQEWFRGIGTTVNYTLSNKGASNYLMNASNPLIGASNAVGVGGVGVNAVGVHQALSGVLSIPMKAFGIRENDVLGLGYALVDLYRDRLGSTTVTASRYRNAFEHTGELYYKYAVNDAISVIPSVQLISHGLGIQQNGFSYVVGLRTSFAF